MLGPGGQEYWIVNSVTCTWFLLISTLRLIERRLTHERPGGKPLRLEEVVSNKFLDNLRSEI